MNKPIGVIGIPLDLGQGRRGVDMGCSAIRYANLQERLEGLGLTVKDLGNVHVPTPETHVVENEKLKYLKEIVEVSTHVSDVVSKAMNEGLFPLILGGDHSIAIGSIAGVAKSVKRFGLIWFDAHGDMNTEKTTPSGNIHGMPLAIALGYGHPDLLNIGGINPKVKPENVVIVGARSIDKDEAALIRESGITVFTMQDVDRLGIGAVMEKAIEIAGHNTNGVHLSLDVDALDPIAAPGVGTPVNGGFTFREGHLAMETLAEANALCSVDVVEVNPILDIANKTAVVAVDLLCSVLGKTVLGMTN